MPPAWLAVHLCVALPLASAARALPRRSVIGLASGTLIAAAAPARSETSGIAAPAVPTLSGIIEGTIALPDGGRAAALALRPAYGLETPDVVYPSWFLGKWQASSTLQSVIAPAGEDLFAPGRNGTDAIRRARAEIGAEFALNYDVRWRQRANQQDAVEVVVDRGYNVASISRAAMGSSAVQDVQEDGPNHLTTYLQPKGAPPGLVYAADLRVVSRRTDPADPARPRLFVCAETTRQTVTAVAGEKAAVQPPKSPLIKEIETIVTYELDAKDPNLMRGYQRTATFLVPDTAYTGDPKLVELAAAKLTSFRGRLVAVDVRTYDLTYSRLPA